MESKVPQRHTNCYILVSEHTVIGVYDSLFEAMEQKSLIADKHRFDKPFLLGTLKIYARTLNVPLLDGYSGPVA